MNEGKLIFCYIMHFLKSLTIVFLKAPYGVLLPCESLVWMCTQVRACIFFVYVNVKGLLYTRHVK